MKPIHLLFALPALVLSGQISGTVSDLNGTPIAGAVVAGNAESDISKPSGAWILGRSARVERNAGSAVRVSSNLTIENGRPKLSWKGFGLDGRKRSVTGGIRGGEFAFRAAEAASSPETLWVYWKGKRLAQVPVESTDTSGITIRIDTAWKDDFGIPWNPKIQYGSLRDERDGQVYRTVKIGNQTWMAENLNFRGASTGGDTVGRCYDDDSSKCLRFGRLYNWEQTNNDDKVFRAYSEDLVQAVCPSGWFAPREKDWEVMLSFLGTKIWRKDKLNENAQRIYYDSNNVFFDSSKGYYDSTYAHYISSLHGSSHLKDSQLVGKLLGTRPSPLAESTPDATGYRVLLSGMCWDDGTCEAFDETANFWSSNNPGAVGPGNPDPGSSFVVNASGVRIESQGSGWLNSIRCMK